MAMTLTLVRQDDFSADIESLSLLSYTDGFSVERDGWAQAIAAEDEERAIETITLYAKGTSHDNLSAKLVALDKLLTKAKWYAESPERYGLWLRAQLTGETGARQALITGARRGNIPVFSPPASPGNIIKSYSLVLERMPLWEGATATLSTDPAINSVGGYTDDIAITVGTDPARIALMQLLATSTSIQLVEYWFGFRTARHGTVANFVSPWELENGTSEGTYADTDIEDDATASGTGGAGGIGRKVEVTFTTTATMAVRVTLTPYQIAGINFENLRGIFDLILCAKCAAGVTARVQLSCGLPGSSSFWTSEPVTVTGTSWKLYNIGRITLPAGGKGRSTTITAMKHSTIRMSAALTVGSAGADALDLDCVVPIPVDEGYGHLMGAGGDVTSLMIAPNGHVSAYQDFTEANAAISSADVDPGTCVVPVGANRMICAAQRSSQSVLTDTFNVSAAYIVPRYRTLRGAG